MAIALLTDDTQTEKMRIAISGTHCCGKTTLIDEFLLAHPDFAYEPEPYTVLQEDYGECFAAEPSADDFYRQLEFNIDRLRRYAPGQQVIYERCPIDFLAYLLALHDLRRDKDAAPLVERSLGMVMDALRCLDLIVCLPINDADSRVAPEAEDLELRSAVDERLVSLLTDDEFDLFTPQHPVVLEARGSTAQRLRMIERAIESQAEKREDR